MHYRIIKNLDHYCQIWRDSSTQLPTLQSFPNEQKEQNRVLLQDQMDELKSCTRITNRLIARDRFVKSLRELLGPMLGLQNEQLDVIFSQSSMQACLQFIKQAQAWDPDLPMSEIYQAARNVWAMTGLQYMFHIPVELTPSIFAYSLLYPYTDNYIDDPDICPDVKGTFNDRFGKHINGERVKPRNDLERRVFDLIGMIESQWERKTCPLVYESLIAIHIAQIKSLRLLKSSKPGQEIDVCGISLEKGGASVVADGYLIAGQLSREQEQFLFGYGAFLQLLDDLQDISKDRENGQSSIFTCIKNTAELESMTSKTFNFGNKVMSSIDHLNLNLNGRTPIMKKMMSETAVRMLIDAVGRSHEYYSEDYISAVEEASPLTFQHITQVRERIARNKTMHTAWMSLFMDTAVKQPVNELVAV